MKKILLLVLISTSAITMTSCANNLSKKGEETKVKLTTTEGDIVVKLYDETPLHRDNFIKLVSDGFYNGVLFHRVIADFMIQTGDPLSKTAQQGQSLGTGDVGYKTPAEIVYPQYYHKRGALAAARQGDQVNPQRESSGCQFYIVWGQVLPESQISSLEKNLYHKQEARLFQEQATLHEEAIKKYRMERNQEKLDELRDSILVDVHKKLEENPTYKLTEQQRKDYTTIGGTPHLDNEYTVFGEVLEGLNVVEKIAATKTGAMDRPEEDIKIIKATILQ